jgi:hypothetical protein
LTHARQNDSFPDDNYHPQMNTAKSYIQLLADLKAKFSANPKRNVRLLGLIFCRPDNKLAREEILPSLAYYHDRSRKNIDFYFAGFDKGTTHESADIIVSSGIPAKPEWAFKLKSFDEFREEIEKHTRWHYSGGSDFILVNCCYDEKGEPHLDYDSAVILTLEALRQQGWLPDVGMFFEKIFRHCEQFERNDEAWGHGLDAVPGSALIELCESFLNDCGGGNPKDIGTRRASVKEAETSKPQTPKLLTGMFRYDLGTRSLIICPSGKKLIVDYRYAEVMSQIFKKEDVLYAIRVSHLDYLQIAIFWEMGKWKEENLAISDSELKKKLKQNLSRIENNQKNRIFREFRGYQKLRRLTET